MRKYLLPEPVEDMIVQSLVPQGIGRIGDRRPQRLVTHGGDSDCQPEKPQTGDEDFLDNLDAEKPVLIF